MKDADPIYSLAVQICEHGGGDPVQVAELLRPEFDRLTRERDNFAKQNLEWANCAERHQARNRELEQALEYCKRVLAACELSERDIQAVYGRVERVLGAKEERQ